MLDAQDRTDIAIYSSVELLSFSEEREPERGYLELKPDSMAGATTRLQFDRNKLPQDVKNSCCYHFSFEMSRILCFLNVVMLSGGSR